MAEQLLREPSRLMTVDLVDRLDRKIGEMARADVLAAGAAFHTVHLFLFDGSERLLLQKLHASRERHPLRWGSSVAAYIFAGETYEAAIRRRARQELGIDVVPQFTGKIAMQDEESLKFVGLFEDRFDGPIDPDTTHIAETAHWSVDAIEAAIGEDPEAFTPTFRELFAFYMRTRRA